MKKKRNKILITDIFPTPSKNLHFGLFMTYILTLIYYNYNSKQIIFIRNYIYY